MNELAKQTYLKIGLITGLLFILQGVSTLIRNSNNIGFIIIISGTILISIYLKYTKKLEKSNF